MVKCKFFLFYVLKDRPAFSIFHKSTEGEGVNPVYTLKNVVLSSSTMISVFVTQLQVAMIRPFCVVCSLLS